MERDHVTLCGASAYEQKYYLNPAFGCLPESVLQELQIMCVLFTEDVGGVLTLVYDRRGDLQFQVVSREQDMFFDEIGSELKIKELRRTKQELLQSLELYYKMRFLHQKPGEQ